MSSCEGTTFRCRSNFLPAFSRLTYVGQSLLDTHIRSLHLVIIKLKWKEGERKGGKRWLHPSPRCLPLVDQSRSSLTSVLDPHRTQASCVQCLFDQVLILPVF